jgi:hypothetical protein
MEFRQKKKWKKHHDGHLNIFSEQAIIIYLIGRDKKKQDVFHIIHCKKLAVNLAMT